MTIETRQNNRGGRGRGRGRGRRGDTSSQPRGAVDPNFKFNVAIVPPEIRSVPRTTVGRHLEDTGKLKMLIINRGTPQGATKVVLERLFPELRYTKY